MFKSSDEKPETEPLGSTENQRSTLVNFACRLTGEPELRGLRLYRGFAATNAYCTELRRRSERELWAFYAAAGLERLRAAAASPDSGDVSHPQLLEICVACHAGDVGLALPCVDPAALGPRLTVGAYAR